MTKNPINIFLVCKDDQTLNKLILKNVFFVVVLVEQLSPNSLELQSGGIDM